MPTIPKYKNWQDFKLRNDPLSNKQKGDRFEVFTKFCLETHPHLQNPIKACLAFEKRSSESS